MNSDHAPFLIIVSSPSGAGKTSLCKKIVENHPNVKLSVSSTTRQKRPGEIDGKDYFFITQEQYNLTREANEFLEYAYIFGNNYGTSKKVVEDALSKGHNVLFDIDWQGARQILGKFDKKRIKTIFILPPSMEELWKRLQSRAQDSEEVVLRRMQKAKDEISHYDEYDYILINEDLDQTYQKVQKIITGGQIEKIEFDKISAFVSNLLKS